MARLNLPILKNPPFNAHYEGEYGASMMRWRELGAIDKAEHIRILLGDRIGEIDSVLEAGCGTGVVSLHVARQGIGSKHAAADIADPTQHAHPGVVDAGIELHGHGDRFPFDDDSFDLVFASYVLEHVPDERGFLAEVARVARNWIYIEVPCELNLRHNMTHAQNSLNIGHINAYTPESFALTLSTSGLDPVDIQIFDHSMAIHGFHTSGLRARLKAMIRGTALRLSPRIASRIFTYHVGALCKVTAPASATVNHSTAAPTAQQSEKEVSHVPA